VDISLFDSPSKVSDAVANAERARAGGLKGYWVPQIMNADTMVTLGVVASQVPDIGLGTSVMAMQTMMPQTMAQQARTVKRTADTRNRREPQASG
jgi:alkanesulfonate monooxygenase SsuD/methylene tetrahydromethanopterin reductase-like flavin-dependent oxidoreductase (luciferase family)